MNRILLVEDDTMIASGIGFDVNETLQKSNTAVIFLTVVDDENTIVNIMLGGLASQADDLQEKGFADVMPDSIRIIVPGVTARFFDWYCATEDEVGFNQYARKVLDDYYPILTEDSYMEQGYTVRISRVDDMVKHRRWSDTCDCSSNADYIS